MNVGPALSPSPSCPSSRVCSVSAAKLSFSLPHPNSFHLSATVQALSPPKSLSWSFLPNLHSPNFKLTHLMVKYWDPFVWQSWWLGGVFISFLKVSCVVFDTDSSFLNCGANACTQVIVRLFSGHLGGEVVVERTKVNIESGLSIAPRLDLPPRAAQRPLLRGPGPGQRQLSLLAGCCPATDNLLPGSWQTVRST